MALNPSGLRSVLSRVMQPDKNGAAGKARDAARANEWASAYNQYALGAMAGLGKPIFTGSEQARFASALKPIFGVPSPSGLPFANALASAIERYWLTPPVLFTPNAVAPGAVTAFPGKPAVVAAILSATSGPKPVSAAAGLIASALDTGTRTVLVTFTEAIPVIVPLS